MKYEIILYRPNELAEHIEVRSDEDKETLWLTQDQIAQLFGRERSVITKHFKNIFKEQELDEIVVSAFFAHTTQLSKKCFTFSKLKSKPVEGISNEMKELT